MVEVNVLLDSLRLHLAGFITADARGTSAEADLVARVQLRLHVDAHAVNVRAGVPVRRAVRAHACVSAQPL